MLASIRTIGCAPACHVDARPDPRTAFSCDPGEAHDQVPNAAAAQAWAVGRALPGDADAEAMRGAVQEVLASSTSEARPMRSS